MQQETVKTNARSSPNKDLPLPSTGAIVTHLLIVRDVGRARHFYEHVLGAETVMDGPPTILRFYNTWLILSTEGAATEDRPGIAARAPQEGDTFSSGLNLRVADIHGTYERWRSRGATFLTEPKEHESEIRCYLRDPDGHLIEVGQARVQGKQ